MPDVENARREIRVTVNRPAATVRSRRTYYAVSASTDSGPAAAPDRPGLSVSGMLPKADLPLQLALVPAFRVDGTQESLLMLHIGTTPPAPERFDVVVSVLDGRGRSVRAQQFTAEISRRSNDTHDRPLDLVAHMSLAPGIYEIRVSVAGHARERLLLRS